MAILLIIGYIFALEPVVPPRHPSWTSGGVLLYLFSVTVAYGLLTYLFNAVGWL